MSSPYSAVGVKAAITVDEFCATCSIGRTSFYAALGAGRIRVLKFGSRTLVPASEVSAFLASLEPGAASCDARVAR